MMYSDGQINLMRAFEFSAGLLFIACIPGLILFFRFPRASYSYRLLRASLTAFCLIYTWIPFTTEPRYLIIRFPLIITYCICGRLVWKARQDCRHSETKASEGAMAATHQRS